MLKIKYEMQMDDISLFFPTLCPQVHNFSALGAKIKSIFFLIFYSPPYWSQGIQSLVYDTCTVFREKIHAIFLKY